MGGGWADKPMMEGGVVKNVGGGRKSGYTFDN